MHFLTTFITVASVISTTFAAAVPPVVARGVTETCGKQVYSITDVCTLTYCIVEPFSVVNFRLTDSLLCLTSMSAILWPL